MLYYNHSQQVHESKYVNGNKCTVQNNVSVCDTLKNIFNTA